MIMMLIIDMNLYNESKGHAKEALRLEWGKPLKLSYMIIITLHYYLRSDISLNCDKCQLHDIRFRKILETHEDEIGCKKINVTFMYFHESS